MASSACSAAGLDLYSLNTMPNNNFLASALMTFMVVTYPIEDVCPDRIDCGRFFSHPPREMARLQHPYNFLVFENGTVLRGQSWPRRQRDGITAPLVLAVAQGNTHRGCHLLSKPVAKAINLILDCADDLYNSSYAFIETAASALQTPSLVLRFRRSAVNETDR
ncbi:uncharacterized protein LOC129593754 [Paramacrobiotus metropolitanus]|uniref:uncharacterized protein LOC129593754 n=1 Tax=Paramacrobiotus metropolitanus TaxID=2943436 RepID=UPI002445C752|nr:uncharacterized protein LOC129593754 [Paramacrobiotus metropolitanus]